MPHQHDAPSGDDDRGEPREQGESMQDDEGRRRGLEGGGFDSGQGYGGAGNSSAYSGESSYGGQAGDGGATMRGAYDGGRYGRSGETDSDRGDAADQDDRDVTP